MNENKEKQITLNGNPITIEQLEEAKKDPKTRIVEKAPGVFIKLERLNG